MVVGPAVQGSTALAIKIHLVIQVGHSAKAVSWRDFAFINIWLLLREDAGDASWASTIGSSGYTVFVPEQHKIKAALFLLNTLLHPFRFHRFALSSYTSSIVNLSEVSVHTLHHAAETT